MADQPSTDRSPWLLGLATANFVVLVAGAWFVGTRLTALEDRDRKHAPAGEVAVDPEAPSRGRRDPKAPPADPKDLPGQFQELRAELTKTASDDYDQYVDIKKDVYEIQRTLKQLQSSLRNLEEGTKRPGVGSGRDHLAPADTAPSAEALAQYRKDAEAAGVKVAPGRVEVRGFLNMSPNTGMPIEYFVTRWPEAGHETLIHVVGPTTITPDLPPEKLRGLVTAVYKGLVVAGFMQGAESAWDGDPNDKEKKPTWVPPKGDTVYVGVRYALHGATHVARVTDWVVDPVARTVLPEDAFRFTGSRRIDDFETGDEALSAEASGTVVSVYWRNPALVETSLQSNLRDDYTYNHKRIPKPLLLVMGKGDVRLDCVRDREKVTLTVLGRVVSGATTPLATAPVLVVAPGEAEAREVPFAKDATIPGAWTVHEDGLKSSAWRVRATVAGETLESTGSEPMYLDLILSKTPIVPEGDGAKPLEPVEVPPAEPTPPEGPGK